MQTRNLFYDTHHFVTMAAWMDPEGATFMLPALWLSRRAPLGSESRILGICLGWGRGRLRLDWGIWLAVPDLGADAWARLGLDDVLLQGRTLTGATWGRAHLAALLQDDPGLRRMTALGAARHHYVKRLIWQGLSRHTPLQKTNHREGA